MSKRTAFLGVILLTCFVVMMARYAHSADQTVTIGPNDRVIVVPAGSAPTPVPPSPPAPPSPPVVTPAGCSLNGVAITPKMLTMSWDAPTRLYTSSVGFGPDDVVVVQFTTGSTSSTNSLPRIAAAEYNSQPSSRIATLSAKPCDFGPQASFGAAGEGNSVTMVFALGNGNGYGYYPVLSLNTTYYLNMRNSPNSSCRANGACDMFVDLVKVGGL